MRAVKVQAFGDPDVLTLIDVPDPTPATGQVLVTTEASGVGGVDALLRSGALASYGYTPGQILGSEIAGTVTAVGDGVDGSWLGQRVWAFTGLGGGYAEQAVVPATSVVPIPVGVSTVDAVTLGSSGMVAHFALRHVHFARGESVLVRGSAGGIGVMAVQLAARGGAGAVAVTASSPERGDRLRALGATHVVDRSGAGDGPVGYDVIVDIVGGSGLPGFFSRLNPNGRMVAVGMVGGPPPADFGTALFAGFQKSMTFATFSADTIAEHDRLTAVADTFTSGWTSVVHEVLPLEKAVLAHQKFDVGEVFGRIVLTPLSTATAVR